MLRRTRRPAGLVGLPLRFVVNDGQDVDTPEPVDKLTKDNGKENSSDYNQSCQRDQERRPSTAEQNTDTTSHSSTNQKTRCRLGSDSSSTGLDAPVNGMDKENRFEYKTPTTHNPTNYTNPHKDTPSCTFPGVHESQHLSSWRNEQLRMTPSSTVPISIPQSNERTQKTRNTLLQLHNHTNSQAPTPVTSKQAQMNGCHHPPSQSSLLTDDGHSVPLHRSKSVPQKLASISASKSHDQPNRQVVPQGKPPLNTTAANQQPATKPVSSVRTPSVGSPTELDSDVVVMKTQGNSRRYKKLKLLGTGGSSKVHVWYDNQSFFVPPPHPSKKF